MAFWARYVDKRRAIIDVLRDWPEVLWKLEQYPKRIERVQQRCGPKAKVLDLADRTLLEADYAALVDFRDEFTPCWEQLTDTEREVLTLRYIEGGADAGVEPVMKRFTVSASTAHRMCREALDRLAGLVYW